MSLTFFVPPGIGDFSAMYAKLCNIDREIIVQAANDDPHRMHPFLEILPKIKDGGYAAHSANASVEQTIPPGTDLASLEDGAYFLAINAWLEHGGKLADWVPGTTTYHYDMDTGRYKRRIEEFINAELPEDRGPIVGVYCSAYGNARHWNFWCYEEWRDFLLLVIDVLPKNTHYVFIGAEYDVQIAELCYAWMQSIGISSSLTLGAFHIGETIELIKKLDYFFIFPSGLGFLADVVNTPNMMWFPKHLAPMRDTFLDPENFRSWQSYHTLFSEPLNAFSQFKTVGIPQLETRWQLNMKSLQIPSDKKLESTIGKTTNGS